MPSREVFSSPAPIPDNVREAMDALCLEVGEEHPTPSSYRLDGDLHPALMLHWRVQACLVGHLISSLEYRNLLPGLRVRLVNENFYNE